MKRFLVFLFFSAFVLQTCLFAQEQISTPASWVPLLEKARALEKKGDYLESQKIYESLLQEETLGRRARSVRSEYEALNLKLLFSPIETPGSFLYEVVPGDTLYDLAKKYGTTAALIQRSNHLSSDGKIYAGKKLKIVRSRFSIVVRKQRNRLTLMADEKPLKHYRVATGYQGSTPEGSFKIANKLENPTWYHAGLVLPPDSPQNILGSRWLGFDTPGYGIHGTALPQTIGTQSSKGCVRMFNSDAEELYDIIPLGTAVTVKK